MESSIPLGFADFCDFFFFVLLPHHWPPIISLDSFDFWKNSIVVRLANRGQSESDSHDCIQCDLIGSADDESFHSRPLSLIGRFFIFIFLAFFGLFLETGSPREDLV